MDYIDISEVSKKAKSGDKLQGKLAVYPTGLPESRVDADELTFWDCISCLLDKPDVIDGADYYLQKQDNGHFKRYGIIREANGLLKVPKQMIYHIVSKYCSLESQGLISSLDKWEEWELVNCYCENDTSKGILRYTCCLNEHGDAFTEDFKTLAAVVAYIDTDIGVDQCHILDEKMAKIEMTKNN